MEVTVKSPRVSNFLQVTLDKNIVDYLWRIIDIAKKNEQSHKKDLVGNMSKSFLLEDLDSFFYKSVEHLRQQKLSDWEPVLNKMKVKFENYFNK